MNSPGCTHTTPEPGHVKRHPEAESAAGNSKQHTHEFTVLCPCTSRTKAQEVTPSNCSARARTRRHQARKRCSSLLAHSHLSPPGDQPFLPTRWALARVHLTELAGAFIICTCSYLHVSVLFHALLQQTARQPMPQKTKKTKLIKRVISSG